MWFTLDGQDSDKEAVAYTSVTITLILLLLIIFHHVYTYTTLFSKLRRLKLCTHTTVDQLFTDTDQEQHTRLLCLSPLPDEDIHRFNELLDIIDGLVNTNDYIHVQYSAHPKTSEAYPVCGGSIPSPTSTIG